MSRLRNLCELIEPCSPDMSFYFNIPVTRLSRGPSHCSTLKLHFEKEAENRRAPLFKGARSRGLDGGGWRELARQGIQPWRARSQNTERTGISVVPFRNHEHNESFHWKLHRLNLFSLDNKRQALGLVTRDGRGRGYEHRRECSPTFDCFIH